MNRVLTVVLLAIMSCAWQGAEESAWAQLCSGTSGSRGSTTVMTVDPVWSPTMEQAYQWVNDGINAAANEMSLQDVPGVTRWVWGYPACPSIDNNQGLRFIIVASPQFVATTAGWAAAQSERTWQRIQIDQEEVATELTRSISRMWERGTLIFAIGIDCQDSPTAPRGPNVAIYHGRSWQCPESQRYSLLTEVSRAGRSTRQTTALGTISHFLSDIVQCSALSNPGGTIVAFIQLDRTPRNLSGVTSLNTSLPTPIVRSPGWARVAVGEQPNLRYVDLRLQD
jgi:hypothetical protein